MAGWGLLIGGLLSYSLLFYFNPIWWLCGFIILSGIQGTIRISFYQHSLLEVILGFVVGMFCGIIGILFI
jgi:membrane-associated phospholipid phosphatase